MSDSNWNKTDIMLERKEQDDDIEWIDGQAHYQGRHVIGRDTEIEGGVYLGGGEREAIVVDSGYGAIPDLYQEAVKEAAELTQGTNSTISEYAPLATYRTVEDSLEFDGEEVENIVERNSAGDDKKIALDIFLNNGVGVCRHAALATGAVLEQFKEDGYINGDISVDRSQDDRGGHAWARYEDQSGVRILDPTQGVFSPIEMTEDEFWDYTRPEDDI